MFDASANAHLHDLLTQHADVMARIEDEDGEMDEMVSPVLTEWVLVSTLMDMSGTEADPRIVVHAAPNMLRSHVIGLLTMAGQM